MVTIKIQDSEPIEIKDGVVAEQYAAESNWLRVKDKDGKIITFISTFGIVVEIQ